MLNEMLKEAGVSVHVIATGAGTGIQQALWETPGSSAYLSGCSFPYATEETEELLGFKPASFCSRETAIDLASAAYMKAFRFGGKKPIGLGLTASVASDKAHRGDHRCHICVMTNDRVLVSNLVLVKGVGASHRFDDGQECDNMALALLGRALNPAPLNAEEEKTAANDALLSFLAYPFFTANGKRLPSLMNPERYALMSGAYNPPHEGHYNVQDVFEAERNRHVVYEVTANPPHKAALTVQELLQRAKMLQGHDRLFTWSKPKYVDKAQAYPGVPLIMGADAMVRMLDPKWGVEAKPMMEEFIRLGTHIYVGGRTIDGVYTTSSDVIRKYDLEGDSTLWSLMMRVFHSLDTHVELSSTEIRSRVLHG